MSFARFVLLGACAFPVIACGAGGEFLFGDPAPDAVTGAGGAVSGAGGAVSSGNVMPSGSGGGSATGSGGAVASNGPSTTASTTASSSASGMTTTTSSSSSGPPPSPLACGGTTCDLNAKEACCWDNYGLLAGEQGTCVTGPIESDGCNTLQAGYGPETRVDCQSSDQCESGKICCGHLENYYTNNKKYTLYDQVTCETTCGGFDTVILCIPNVTACPIVQSQGGNVQTVCKPSKLLPTGYYVCGNPP